MSGYKNFAVIGAGAIGTFIIHQLLTDKAAGTIDVVVVLTRQASVASATDAFPLIKHGRDLEPMSEPVPS